MVLSERYSSLSLYNGWDHADYSALANIPVCSIHDYHTLSSLSSLAATQMDGSQNANILAVVRSVSYSTLMWPMYVSFVHEYQLLYVCTHHCIVVGLCQVGAKKQITGKTGKQLQRCEVRLMDPTCPSFSLFMLVHVFIHKYIILYIVYYVFINQLCFSVIYICLSCSYAHSCLWSVCH